MQLFQLSSFYHTVVMRVIAKLFELSFLFYLPKHYVHYVKVAICRHKHQVFFRIELEKCPLSIC